MSNYNDVRSALGAAVQSYQPNLNVYYYVPRTIVPPAAIIQPVPHRTINYVQAYGSELAKWRFTVMIVIGLVDEESAQEQAGDLISPGSALIRALNTRLASGYAQVTEGGLAEMMFDTGLYTYAELSVVVTA